MKDNLIAAFLATLFILLTGLGTMAFVIGNTTAGLACVTGLAIILVIALCMPADEEE